MTPSGWTARLDPKIQVCGYSGKYPNHDELDNWMVSTKLDAYKTIHKDQEMCKRKHWEQQNYRIVDTLNRFKTIFIES
ncbi:MAG TPA: hypothetical protein ENH85_02190 [Candidatus Scalindua sp.]|nr:hypothetical protein [Candidatus Scalindua sp.]